MSTININNSGVTLCAECIICGDSVTLNEEEVMKLKHGFTIDSKVCQKCKDAILSVRRKMDRYQEDIENSYQGEVANDI